MGSIVGVILLLLVEGTITYGFIWPHFVTPYAIKDLNENIELPYEFGVAVSEYDIEEKLIEDVDDLGFILIRAQGTYSRLQDTLTMQIQ